MVERAAPAVTRVLGQARLKVLVKRREELLGGLPFLLGADQQREVLRHLAGLDRLDDDVFKGLGEGDEGLVAVELAAVHESTGPREDRGDRVGGGGLAGLVLTVVAR